jgi:hypothetical protein
MGSTVELVRHLENKKDFDLAIKELETEIYNIA